jgi:hypothetical protein
MPSRHPQFRRIRPILGSIAFLSAAALCSSPARANLTIVPTFDSSITSDPNALTIETGINAAINTLEADISTSITVTVDFQSMSSGLGQSDTYYSTLSYTQYLSDLTHNQTLSANDVTALASLPAGPNNPVNGNANVLLTLPLLRAIGESTGSVPFDSTISLNLSLMNLSRTGTQDPSKYDLQAVTAHELDEVLGAGGAGSVLSSGGPTVPTGPVGSLDLFRYSANGVRSFTTDPTATPYFSIDGGATNLSFFNQDGGGDYADWASSATPQVQDAYGTPGSQPNLGPNELTALDVVGYTLATPVPEPGSFALFGIASAMLAGLRRRAGAAAA